MDKTTRNDPPVVIVGAGLAGLTCARRLTRAKIPVLLLEREEAVGGRVRTSISQAGYRLDRGFQVVFAAYPALRRHVKLSALSPRYFASGTSVVYEGRMVTVGHPLYDPASLVSTIRSGLVRPRDIAALTALFWQARSFGDAPLPDSGRSTADLLRNVGASQPLVDNVFVPFFGGVSFDRTLATDASFFGLVLRSLSIGRSFLPALGMQQLPQCLARSLPAGTVRLGEAVDAVHVDRGQVRGVQVGGKTVVARAVVIATEAPEAARLSRVNPDVPRGHRTGTTVYFASERPLYRGPRTVVHAEESLVNEVVQLTNVAPEYAPPGRHLLCANVLHEMEGTDGNIARQVEADVKGWLPGAGRVSLEPVGVIRVPYAQFEQPPGIYARLSHPVTATAGLYLAGEYLHSSSIQGAMRGGELAAQAVMSGRTASVPHD